MGLNLGSFLWILGSSASFLVIPIMAPSIKISLTLLLSLSFPHLDYSVFWLFKVFSLSLFFFPYALPFSPIPMLPVFSNLVYFPFQDWGWGQGFYSGTEGLESEMSSCVWVVTHLLVFALGSSFIIQNYHNFSWVLLCFHLRIIFSIFVKNYFGILMGLH